MEHVVLCSILELYREQRNPYRQAVDKTSIDYDHFCKMIRLRRVLFVQQERVSEEIVL